VFLGIGAALVVIRCQFGFSRGRLLASHRVSADTASPILRENQAPGECSPAPLDRCPDHVFSCDRVLERCWPCEKGWPCTFDLGS